MWITNLALGTCATLAIAASPGIAQHLVGVKYNPRPRRLTQTEWLRPNFPATWGLVDANSEKPGANHIQTDLYVMAGSSAFNGQNATTLPVSELVKFTRIPLPKPHRYAYRPGPQNNNSFSFFLISTHGDPNAPNPDVAITDVGVVDLTRPIDGPVPAAVNAMANVSLAKPVRANVAWTNGTADVYVDVANGNDNQDGTTPSKAVKTIAAGLALMRLKGTFKNGYYEVPGKTMLVKPGIYAVRSDPKNHMNIAKFKLRGLPGNPMTIIGAKGSSLAILDGFSFDYETWVRNQSLPHPEDPYAAGLSDGIQLIGTRDAVIENFGVRGFRRAGAKPDNTRRVSLRFLDIHNTGKWGIHAYTNNFEVCEDLVIEGCRIRGTLSFTYTDQNEHGIYIAGFKTKFNPTTGQWEPLMRRIRISYNEIWHVASHCIQVNGCQEHVLINNNRLLQGGLGGIDCTGTSNLKIVNNVIGESLREAIVIYQDHDPIFGHRFEQELQVWKQSHFQALRNIDIAYNTMYVPPTKWTKGSDPRGFPVIKVDEEGGYDEEPDVTVHEALVEPFDDVVIHDNILVSSGPLAVRYKQSAKILTNGNAWAPRDENHRLGRMLEGVTFSNNHFYGTAPGNPTLRYGIFFNTSGSATSWTYPSMTLAALQTTLPQWTGNVFSGDPLFRHLEPIQFIGKDVWWPDLDARMLKSDYRVRLGSPVIDKGQVPFPAIDKSGVSRPRGLGPDIGAHESF